jgi:hypothetical protein
MSQTTPQNELRWIDVPQIVDARGALSFVEGQRHIPFDIRRVFFLHDVPNGAERGGHALRECEQVLIALGGTIEVLTSDGTASARHILSTPTQGLYLPPLVWRELKRFSPGSVCLALCSQPYSEADYFREFTQFLAAVKPTT